MKVANEQRKKLKGKRGITLIALVITIIVLLILAGISIMMLTGNNSILNRAGQAKETTDIASIKERAELVKLGMNINSYTGKNKAIVTRNKLLGAIKDEFTGSTKKGTIVTTADNQYDIIVDKELNIQVVKHKDRTSDDVIDFTYTVLPTESRAVVLRVYPLIDVKPYEEYAQEILDSLPTGEERENELIKLFVEGELYYNLDYYKDMGIENPTLDDILDMYGYETIEEFVEGVSYDEIDTLEEILLNWEYIKKEQYEETYGKEITIACNGETEKINPFDIDTEFSEFGITKNGEYTVEVSRSDGAKGEEDIEITEVEKETYSKLYASNTVEKIDGYKVTIPAGFYKGTSENIGHVTTGLVITDSIDNDGESNGNEFVWIPVINVVSDTEANGTNNKAMAVKVGDNYRGLLYDFSGISSTVISGCTSTNFTNNSGKREPVYLTDSVRADASKYNTIGITQESLQAEYNAMIESVKTHGGFYVARYEMGIQNSKAVSKLNVTPTSSHDDATKRWYGLFDKAKTYTNSKNSVTSSMIWGSQYDAMLNFALNGADKEKITAQTNGNDAISISKTGLTKASDSINNIYDLEGNMCDWTLEAESNFLRNVRGGSYGNSSSPSSRNGIYPDNNYYERNSSRLALYIK